MGTRDRCFENLGRFSWTPLSCYVVCLRKLVMLLISRIYVIIITHIFDDFNTIFSLASVSDISISNLVGKMYINLADY